MNSPHSPFGPPHDPREAPPQASPYGQPGPSPYGAPPQASPYGQPPMGPGGAVNPYAAPIDPTYSATGIGMDPQMDHMLATRGNRFAGSLVDGLVAAAGGIPGLVLLAVASTEAAVILAGLGVLAVTIYQWFLIATTGQSLAKKWLRMKIVKVDGSDVDFVSGVVARVWAVALLGLVPFAGNFVALIDALMIFGQDHRCLHDKIAGTKVINV